jgi:hypothetical protein
MLSAYLMLHCRLLAFYPRFPLPLFFLGFQAIAPCRAKNMKFVWSTLHPNAAALAVVFIDRRRLQL